MEFSPTQTRMLILLSDGRPHTKEELHGCLWDELSKKSAINYHLLLLRKLLRTRGEDIICEFSRRRRVYRHVRLLSSAYDGYQ